MKKPSLDKLVYVVFEANKKLVVDKICPFCKKKIFNKDFRDLLSKKEYSISGLCQGCQDSFFGG